MAREGLAHLERGQGNYEEALRLYQAALRVWQDWGLQAAMARELECLALVTAAQGRLHEAVRLAGAAGRLREQTGTRPMPDEQLELDESLDAAHEQMPAALYHSLLEEGRGMSLPEAIAYAGELPVSDNSSTEN
jgi:tetratricopeptide (TPR) repeat protein